MLKKLPFIPPFVLAAVMLAGMFSACQHDPVTPPPNPPDTTHKIDSTKGDTTRRVLKITPDSGSTQMLTSITFKAVATPGPLPKPYTLLWQLDTAAMARSNTDTLSVMFNTSGKHKVCVTYLDSTGKTRAIDSVSVNALPKPADPNDTTSHNFTWQEFTNLQGQNNMTGCWVFAPDDIYSVNDALYHFDGTNWNKTSLNGMPAEGLSGSSFFGFTSKDFWLTTGTIAFHWNGSYTEEYRVNRLVSGGASPLHSAWGTSSNDMYFVGNYGTIVHFDGTNWTKFPAVTGKELHSVWGTASNDVWAAGFNDATAESALLHYDGNSWTSIDPQTIGNIGPGNDGLNAVWCVDSMGRSIVVASGSHVWRKSEFRPWFSDSGGVTNDYSGGFVGLDVLQGNSANDIFTGGSFGFFTHWNGLSWHRYDQFYAPGSDAAFAQMSIKGNTVCFAGVKNGSSWVLVGQRK